MMSFSGASCIWSGHDWGDRTSYAMPSLYLDTIRTGRVDNQKCILYEYEYDLLPGREVRRFASPPHTLPPHAAALHRIGLAPTPEKVSRADSGLTSAIKRSAFETDYVETRQFETNYETVMNHTRTKVRVVLKSQDYVGHHHRKLFSVARSFKLNDILSLCKQTYRQSTSWVVVPVILSIRVFSSESTAARNL